MNRKNLRVLMLYSLIIWNFKNQENNHRIQINYKIKKIETNKLTEQFKSELNQKEQHKQISTENDSPQNNLNNQSCKRKRLSKSMKGNYKKKPIEQSSKLRKHGLKTLEGQLFDRPLERMEMKYFYQSMNHLPLRYATYRSKLNIPFAVLTLNMELEINKYLSTVFKQ
uniref:Uncharacterized protein n=1 Tax=Sipha flava TaxID=143950 RepID=A0A2S2QL65_9HEMI